MNRHPLISLILLSYNYEHYVGEAIRSVLAQTYPHWELVVVDDASTDGSLGVIRSFPDPRIHVLPLQRNGGPSTAYNLAYEHCRGEYVGSLDSDDFLAPRKLERQVEEFAAHPKVDVLGTFVTEVDAAGRASSNGTAAWFNQKRNLNDVESWLIRNHLCHSSVLLRRSTHDHAGLLNPLLHGAADYELWLRCLARGARFRVVPEPLLFSRQHESNTWKRIGQGRRFLELAYLFSAHLAWHLKESRRADLLAPCAHLLASHFLAAAGEAERGTVVRELLGFPFHPRDFAGFSASFELGCGPRWPAILEAIEPSSSAAIMLHQVRTGRPK
jgi:glycosyltransferase involved in cell wall biosynthesis